MNRQILGLLSAVALVPSLAYAQLTSVDDGAAVIDSNGLMWANTVGIDLGWSGYPGESAQPGTAQSWIAGLNATHYGGYDDWTLATGDGGTTPNTTTNQLGELFNTDCGNPFGQSSVLTNSGRNCTALSAVKTVLPSGSNFLSSSSWAGNVPGDTNYADDYVFWVYSDTFSRPELWTGDTYYVNNYGFSLEGGDALAVREVHQTPEIDPASTASGLMLLLGGAAVLRGRRKVAA